MAVDAIDVVSAAVESSCGYSVAVLLGCLPQHVADFGG